MSIALGIDFGTTSVAVTLFDSEKRDSLNVVSYETGARIESNNGRAEQDIKQIFSVVQEILSSFDPELCKKISVVGIAGQMHGILFWNSRDRSRSNLISWQDQRAAEGDFLKRLRQRSGDGELQTGYGTVTLAWIQEYLPNYLSRYDRTSTIMDYFAAHLCNDDKSLTDPTNGASWGLFDVYARVWDWERIRYAGIPESFLPSVVPSRSLRGVVSFKAAKELGIPAGIPVVMPIGGNQAAMIASLKDPKRQISLTVATGGQLSVVLDQSMETVFPLPAGLEIRPYPDGRLVAVVASLCGGRAIEWLVTTLVNWCRELGGGALELNDVYLRLSEYGLKSMDSPLEVCSSLMGERHAHMRTGAIRGINLQNFSLGNLSSALSLDIIQNLKSMMPEKFLQGRDSIVGSGNAVRRIPLIQRSIEQVFGLPLELSQTVEESACGAAIHALDTLNCLATNNVASTDSSSVEAAL